VVVLGPDHPETLATRSNLAYWRREAGDAAGAAAGFEALLPDVVREKPHCGSTCATTPLALSKHQDGARRIFQGAAVIGFVTANVVPDGVVASDVPRPMPPAVADHVAAVTLFGKPSNRFMRAIGQPPIAIGPLYAAKTTDLRAPNDPICSDKGDMFAHGLYAADGMVGQAATSPRVASSKVSGRTRRLCAATATPCYSCGRRSPSLLSRPRDLDLFAMPRHFE
jgi:hypothetical protein